MTFQPPQLIPGINPEANRVLSKAFGNIGQELRTLFTGQTITPVKTADYVAQVGELVRVIPPAGGMKLTIPAGTSANQAGRIQIAVLNVMSGGAVKVSVVGGAQTINSAASLNLTAAGLTELASSGTNGWSSMGGGSGGLSPPVPLSALATQAANTVVANATGAAASPTAFPVGANTVLGRQGASIVAAQLVGGQVATGTLPLTTLATQTANTVLANATAGAASPTAITVGAESVLGQTSGNLQGLASAVQTALIRAAGSVFWASAAANQVLRRAGSGDLGMGTLVDGNIGANQITAASQAQMAQRTLKGNLTLVTANEADHSTQTCRENISGGLVTQATAQLQTASVANVTPGAYTIQGNTLEVGSEYLCEFFLFCGRGATVTATNLIIELLANGAVVRTLTIAINIGASTNGAAKVEGRMTARTIGAGGTMMYTLFATQTVAAVAPALSLDPPPTGAAVATTALDTTANRTLEMRARLSATTATVYVQLLQGTISKVR